MSMHISFDHNWYCTHRGHAGTDDVVDDSPWTPVELPHSISEPSETATQGNWWYRKRFQCASSNREWMQAANLTFTPAEENSVTAIVWLNGVKVFAGQLQAPQTSVDLPEHLLHSDLTPKSTDEHTLIVCCRDARLSFSTFLTMSCDRIVQAETSHINASIHDYVTSFDEISQQGHPASDSNQSETASTRETVNGTVPLLTIVMLIVGTRGDVEPFIAYGKTLRAVGHRVRLATHEKFRKFVREHGLEFYPLACDPNEIMSFMVQNSGIFPSISSILKGDIFRRRGLFLNILESTWSACTNADDETGALFHPDAIIGNPISYGHIHCAEKLGIPFHMVFTMPYSATKAFPHPLASVAYSKQPRERLNVFSYTLVDSMMWLGIGDLMNKFRMDTLHLPPLHMQQVISMMANAKVPHTYCWSPSLVPKPSDWPFYIDTSGYFFLDLGKTYTSPPADLLDFLGLRSDSDDGGKKKKSPPIFIGFGSITGHDSDRLLVVILKALQQTGHRALLTGFEANTDRFSEMIFKIDDIPYDWLFQHVAAVCHHGGAGTTAAGLRAGKPTIIVPFFGDQFFWASVVEKTGAGPAPIPGRDITVERLVEAFNFAGKPSTQAAAKRVQEAIALENGCAAAIRAFHANLPLAQMRSDLDSTYPACFRLADWGLQISQPVARVLLAAGLINESQLSHHPTREWNLAPHPHSSSKSNKQDSPRGGFHLSSLISVGPAPGSRSAIDEWGSTVTDTVMSVVGNVATSLVTDPSKYTGGQSSASPDIGQISSTNGNETHNTSILTSTNDYDLSALAKQAANASGFPSEVCERILSEFIEHQKRLRQGQTCR